MFFRLPNLFLLFLLNPFVFSQGPIAAVEELPTILLEADAGVPERHVEVRSGDLETEDLDRSEFTDDPLELISAMIIADRSQAYFLPDLTPHVSTGVKVV